MTAHDWAIEGMQSCLPKDCPLPFTVESAKFIKKGVAFVQVKLFDGLPGTLQVSQASYQGAFTGWCLQWKDLPGGAINWIGTAWERCHHLEQSDQPVQPQQLTLLLT